MRETEEKERERDKETVMTYCPMSYRDMQVSSGSDSATRIVIIMYPKRFMSYL